MSLYLIRHGLTQGNLHRRYIGARSDEPLCPQGLAELWPGRFPPVSRVICSPMRRCLQTAQALYPALEPEIVEDFRECDFGLFEGRSAPELKGDPAYQAWVDSGGSAPFPDGESPDAFRDRCVRAFDALRPAPFAAPCAIIAHGGTIMAIMERRARPRGGYYDFQIPCAAGFALARNGRYRRLLPPVPSWQSDR